MKLNTLYFYLALEICYTFHGQIQLCYFATYLLCFSRGVLQSTVLTVFLLYF